jgi:zinc resistance-associated protein
MSKSVVVAMAVLAIAGSSTVFAQQPNNDREGGPRFEHRHHQFSAEDRAAFVDARIAALKAGLELTPDQAKNWPAFEQALRDIAKLRAQIRAARDAHEQNATPTTPFERMTQRADNMAETSAALRRIADAGTPLYQTLDDAQKEPFKKLARMLQPHHHRTHAWNDGVGRGGQSWRHERG